MTAYMSAAHPILPAQDLDATEAFYRQIGFLSQGRYGDYMILRRDSIELHFWLSPDRALAEASSCYIRTHDVDRLHAALGEPPGTRITAPQDRPWGMREFYLMDPNGILLRIGQLISA